MKSTLTTTAYLLGMLTLPLGADDKPVRKPITFEDTTSPNGAYVVAWSAPKLSESDWESISNGEEANELLLDAIEEETENPLVDVKSGRKITEMGSCFWAIPAGGMPNHQFLDVAWSSSSDLVVVLHGQHYEYGAFEAVQLAKGSKVAQLDFGTKLEELFRKRLTAQHPAEYKRDKEDLVIKFEELKALGGRKFSVEAWAYVPKQEDTLHHHSTVTFTVPFNAGKLSLQVLEFKTVRNDDDESPAEAEK